LCEVGFGGRGGRGQFCHGMMHGLNFEEFLGEDRFGEFTWGFMQRFVKLVRRKFSRVFRKEIRSRRSKLKLDLSVKCFLGIGIGNRKLGPFRYWIQLVKSEIFESIRGWKELAYWNQTTRMSEQPFRDWNRYFVQQMFVRWYGLLAEPWQRRDVFN
jgi:hypothetical protein